MKIIPLILALGLAVGGLTVPSAPSPIDEGGVTMVAAPAFTGILRPGQALQLTGAITNSSAQTADIDLASVYISPVAVSSRGELSRWLSDDHPPAENAPKTLLGSLPMGNIAAGQTRSFSITIPAESLAALGSRSGVFPLAVRLSSGDIILETARTVISWYAQTGVPRLNLAMAMPLDAPPSTSGLVDSDSLQTLVSTDGSLAQQLDVALAHVVALGVDPEIVASVRVLGANAPVEATEWLSRLESSPNDLFSLNYADSDQLLLHRAGATQPLTPLTFPVPQDSVPAPQPSNGANGAGNNSVSSLGQSAQDFVAVRTTIDNLVWPSTSTISETDLDFLAKGGTTRTIVPSTSLANRVNSPVAAVGKHELLVSDAEVSALLTKAAAATTDTQWASTAAALTATLAVAAEQSPASTLVATFGRSAAPNTRMLGSTLNAIDAVPWVIPTRLSAALASTPVNATLVAQKPSTSDRDAAASRLLTSEQALTQFSSVANDPTLITGPQRLSLLALSSATWNGNPSGWEAAVQAHLTTNSDMLESVSIPESSSINLLQEKENLPITVRNELDFPVTVYVTVRPDRAILDVLDSRVKLTVEANSQSKASVPVQSVANGEVRTTVSLTSATGVHISTPTVVMLNVLAGWETTVTVVLMILVVLLFGAGIVRTILRSRKRRAERISQTESTP